MSEKPAEDWQSSCVTRLLPLRGKDFDVELDELVFDYGTGLAGRLRLRTRGSKTTDRPAHSIPRLLLAPADAFGAMHVDDLNAELAHWSKWLARQTLAEIRKLDAEQLRPFQPLTGAKLAAAYRAWKAEHDPDPDARITRQRRALASVAKRFPAFARHVKQVWGLPVPRTLIAVQALFEAGEPDSMAADVVRGSEISPAGVLDRLAPGGLVRKVIKGGDERCHGRYYRDPPEFLTFAHGGEAGLHFGLWYDLDDKLPSVVVCNYARDTSETWLGGATPLTAFVKRVEDRHKDIPSLGRGDFRRQFLREILAWFAEAEVELHQREARRRSPIPTPAAILGGWGVRCAGAPSPCDVINDADAALRGKPDVVRRWTTEANKRLAAGDARMALVLGRSMHWIAGPTYARKAGPLLEKAYEALGRDALRDITRAHYAHRDAPSVDMLVDEG
jgi:hypothetical protein